LTKVGDNVSSLGAGSACVTTDPAGRFLYVANLFGYEGGNEISIFRIDPNSGMLSYAGGISDVEKTNFSSIAIAPSGKFAYVTVFGQQTGVLTFAVNGLTGNLTQIGDVTPGDHPSTVLLHPSGRFAYVIDNGDDAVSAFAINPNTGALTSLGPAVPAGQTPIFGAVDLSGGFLYVGNSGDQNGNEPTISSYHIDPVYGFLYTLPETPVTGVNLNGIAVVDALK